MTNIKKTAQDTVLKGITVDKRKNYICILDVETTGLKEMVQIKKPYTNKQGKLITHKLRNTGLAKPLIYDLGFAIADRKGNIIYKRSLLIKEILCNGPLMVNAYYSEKLPKYMEDLANGNHELVSWNEAMDILGQALGHFEVKTIGAYNWNFDKRALKNTNSYLTGEELVIDIEKELCLWSLACETIFSQKSYAGIALEQGWYNEDTQNILTNAEVCYRYLTGNFEFEEDHTGLSDVLIEVYIMAHAFRQKKATKSGVIGSCWKIPNTLHADKKVAFFEKKAQIEETPLVILELEV